MPKLKNNPLSDHNRGMINIHFEIDHASLFQKEKCSHAPIHENKLQCFAFIICDLMLMWHGKVFIRFLIKGKRLIDFPFNLSFLFHYDSKYMHKN